MVDFARHVLFLVWCVCTYEHNSRHIHFTIVTGLVEPERLFFRKLSLDTKLNRKTRKKTTFFCIYMVGSQTLHCNTGEGDFCEKKVFPVRHLAVPYAELYGSCGNHSLLRKSEPVLQRNHRLLLCGLSR